MSTVLTTISSFQGYQGTNVSGVPCIGYYNSTNYVAVGSFTATQSIAAGMVTVTFAYNIGTMTDIQLVCQISTSSTEFINANGPQGSSTGRTTGSISVAGIDPPAWTQYWRQVGPIVSFSIDATNNTGSDLSGGALLATGFPAPRTDVAAVFIGMDWSKPFRAAVNAQGELRLTWMGGITSGQSFAVGGNYLTSY